MCATPDGHLNIFGISIFPRRAYVFQVLKRIRRKARDLINLTTRINKTPEAQPRADLDKPVIACESRTEEQQTIYFSLSAEKPGSCAKNWGILPCELLQRNDEVIARNLKYVVEQKIWCGYDGGKERGKSDPITIGLASIYRMPCIMIFVLLRTEKALHRNLAGRED